MTQPTVPNVSLGAKSGDGLSPLNRPGVRAVASAAGPDGSIWPFDPRQDGNTVEVVDTYLRQLDGPAASSERLRVLFLESQQESPRISIRGMETYLDDGSDQYDVPDEDPAGEEEAVSYDGGSPSDTGEKLDGGSVGDTSVDGSTVTES